MSLRESVRERIARENQQKVLRRRAESRYLSTLAADLDIERLASLQAEVVQEAEARAIEAASQPLKPRVRADPSFVAAEPESLRVLKRFDLSAKCVAVTHGGATLWTGGADGVIMVRSGITGDEAYSIPTPDAGAVTTLFATATHVFAGFSNGLVRVFDHCAFVNITEGRFHSSAVTCFAPITRGGDTEHIQMLSAGDDGCLVKWDTEARGFAAMFKIDLQLSGGISCLCTHGQKAFAGSRNGTITMVDTVVAQIHDVIAAHTDGILALACTAAGYVFSGSSDNQLRVWRGAELVACHPTSSPILVIQVDDSNERVWSGEQDGTVRVWRANEADGFVLEKALPSLGAPVLQLHTETALDAVKIWSLGSTGFNKMWYSSANRSERHITNTVSILKAIATQDGVELDKWRLTVAKLHHINTRRKLQLARLLLTQRDDGLRRRYLWIWRLYLLRANSRRRNLGVSQRLQVDHQTQLARRYFTNWFEWYHAHQKRRLKSTYSRLLLSHANMSSVHHYFAKMQAFTRIVKAAKKRRDLVSILGLQSQRSAARNVMRKWLKFTRGRQIAARKIAFVSAMLRTSDLCLARLYFTKWGGWLQRRKVKAQRTEVCQVLLSMSAVTRRRHAYMVWRRFVLRRQALKRKQCVSAAMFATTERGLLLSYFKRWAGFRLVKIADAAAKHREETQAELDVVRARYAELGALIEEKKRLDAKEEELRQQDEELQAEDVRILRLTQTLSELEAELEEASEKSRAHRQSLAEQFATVIANLKAQVINFHQDAALIGQIRDKAKAVPVTKTFLEAHQSVKRVVVELTGKAHSAPDEPWPLTPAKLAAMPSHQLTVILQAIKTMIVSFDMMDRATRDSLQTDKEIVVNASWLLQMATRANDHRRRTLGRGALRAK